MGVVLAALVGAALVEAALVEAALVLGSSRGGRGERLFNGLSVELYHW